jgi:hypothetical protein
METISLIPRILEIFYKDTSVTLDVKNNPCLFPLYLFEYFHKKYSENQMIEEERSSYYSRQSVYCKYEKTPLLKDYSGWFIANTKWNHVSFFLQIGKADFVPFTGGFEYPKGLVAYIHLQVFADNITISVNMETCSDFSVVSCLNKIADDITTEFKKYPYLSKFTKAQL